MAARGEDVDVRAELLRDAEGGRVEGPYDTPWYTRDIDLVDPDGYRVTRTAPRRANMREAPEFGREVEASLGKRPD